MAAAGAVGVIIAAFVAAGCGGPLDTPDPRPRRDAGIDTGAGGYRSIDAAPEVRRDAPVDMAPDLRRDARPDASDATADAGWPVVPYCVTGLPPSPQMSPETIPPINVSCASSVTILARLLDPAGQGFVYDAQLKPSIDGFSLYYGSNVCSGPNDAAEIELSVGQSVTLPPASFNTSLIVTVHGPPPQTTFVSALQINTVPIDFDVDPAVVDFGVVTVGQIVRMPVMVANARDSVPLQDVFPTQYSQGPFQLYESLRSNPFLQPGDTQDFLQAMLQAPAPGTYDATFLVSAFPPGATVNTACGVVRTVTMHAQVVLESPPDAHPDAHPDAMEASADAQ